MIRTYRILLLVLLILANLGRFEDCLGGSSGNRSEVRLENSIPKLVINDKVINNMFSVSVYCIKVDPTTERWLSEMKKVVDHVSALKIPIMRFQMSWKDYDHSTSVPKSAEEAALRFHTENLDMLLDYAAKKNVYIELPLIFPSHWELPSWWIQYKDNRKGYQMVDPVSDPYGRYNRRMGENNPIASYQSRTHRELMKALITRLIQRYRTHPAVIGWEINPGPTGEGGYGPSYIAIRFDPQMKGLDFGTAMADYSPVATENFRLWLKDKYLKLEALNTKWRTNYISFKEVDPPLPKKSSIVETFQQNGDIRPEMIDWQEFRYDIMLDVWKFLSSLVRSLDPEKIIIGKPAWTPVFMETGSERMLATSEEVSTSGLIDVEHAAVGIVASDHSSLLPFPTYRVDYANHIEFSRGHNTPTIITLENWYERDPRTRGQQISTERAIAVKDAIRDRGGYLRFSIVLPHDSLPEGKPSWSWDEIRNLIEHSKTNELKNKEIKRPLILFYYDVRNIMTHYYQEKGNLRSSRIYYQISKSLFDAANGQLQTGFISAYQVADGGLSFPESAKVLVMANQRFISADICKQLKTFVSSGGRLVLIGSNGIFSKTNEKDTTAVEKLATGLNKKQVVRFFNWGINRVARVPVISITTGGTDYLEIPEDGDPASNFALLKRAIGNVINTFDVGSFTLQRRKRISFQQGVKNRFPASQQFQKNPPRGKCGDGICDEFEKWTGMCRGDCLNFN